MQSMPTTTINVDVEVRDRLRAFCGGGLSYSEALTLILDQVEVQAFFAEARRKADDPDYPWLDADDLRWD